MLSLIKNNGLSTEEKSVISAFARVQQDSPFLLNGMRIICGIYKITNPNGKVYIGQSVNCERRKKVYSNINCADQPRLYNSIKKYGWHKHRFEIIDHCLQSELNDKEIYYIDLFQCLNNENGLNLKAGGLSKQLSIETKTKISKSHKLNPPKWTGGTLSFEHKEKIKLSLLKLYASGKRVCATKGKPRSIQAIEASKQWGNKHRLGKVHTKETRMKMSLSHKQRKPKKICQ